MDYIINAYVRLRSGDADENGQDLQYTSARTLLGILRLAQALVRLGGAHCSAVSQRVR